MESPVLKGNFEVGRGAPGGPRRAGGTGRRPACGPFSAVALARTVAKYYNT